MPLSKKSVDKAGTVLRRGSGQATDYETVIAALDVVWEYRRQFQYPLTQVNANLRHYVKGAGCEVYIAQRLKRLPRIMEKLIRQPRMRLSQMQDVGECRAILPDETSIRKVLSGITQRWDVITIVLQLGGPARKVSHSILYLAPV